MYKSNFLLYIFLFFSKKVLSQFPPGLNITQCSPVPAAVYIEQFAQLQLQKGCQSLELPYQGILNLSCCEIEFKEKKNSSAPRIHGCMSFLSNYIDNHRYEDIVDWIKRGKIDGFQRYTIFLGKSLYDAWRQLELIKNETEYEFYKLNCLSRNIFYNYLFLVSFLIFLVDFI